ncbi:TIGR03089 family protein [uncultured Kocuria sp.]|uniref:TIGR03089 family protein n=1 Tax=uncultured Kocuria sp. TaxID=259305 RepID=UPI002611C27D|nr:TIGR03089 family protein [uncultured Kocuria sp.]
MDTPIPRSVPLLMDKLRSSSRPALIWYGGDGERVELSGRVLDNWVAKTANLWVDELDLEAGDVVALGEEAHWRSLAAALGTWTMGAAVRAVDPLEGAAEAGDRAVVGLVDAQGGTPPLLDRVPPGARAVLLDRPALSLGYRGDLPAGDVLDYCAEVRSHADVYDGFEEPAPEGDALRAAGTDGFLAHGRLLPAASGIASGREDAWGTAAAVHVPGRRMDAEFLLRALAVLAVGRAVVVTDRPADAADEAWRSVLASENAVGF